MAEGTLDDGTPALTWWHRFAPQVRGGRFQTPAPLDFLVVSAAGVTHYIEVKEVAGKTLSLFRFSAMQKHLLQNIPNCWALVRFYSGKARKGSNAYWEDYVLMEGCDIDWSKPSIRLSDHWEDRVAWRMASPLPAFGFNPEAGLTERGNDTEGLSLVRFPPKRRRE